MSHDFEIQSNLNKKHSLNEADQKVTQKSRNQPGQSLAILKENSLSLLLKESSQGSSENLKVSAQFNNDVIMSINERKRLKKQHSQKHTTLKPAIGQPPPEVE